MYGTITGTPGKTRKDTRKISPLETPNQITLSSLLFFNPTSRMQG